MHSNYCKKVSGIDKSRFSCDGVPLEAAVFEGTQTGSRGGIAQHRTIPRGSHASAVNDNRGCGDCNDEILGTVTTDSTVTDVLNATMSTGYDTEEHQTENQTLPSLHEVREKAAVEGWSRVRTSLQLSLILCQLVKNVLCVTLKQPTDVYSVHLGHTFVPNALKMLTVKSTTFMLAKYGRYCKLLSSMHVLLSLTYNNINFFPGWDVQTSYFS